VRSSSDQYAVALVALAEIT